MPGTLNSTFWCAKATRATLLSFKLISKCYVEYFSSFLNIAICLRTNIGTQKRIALKSASEERLRHNLTSPKLSWHWRKSCFLVGWKSANDTPPTHALIIKKFPRGQKRPNSMRCEVISYKNLCNLTRPGIRKAELLRNMFGYNVKKI